MKFIICADARTGSHMLQSALNNHPDITCYGEILNPGSKDSLLQNRTPIEAIDFAFNSAPNVGFIIHRHRDDLPEVWEYLRWKTFVKVLFTDRLNHVRRYASYKIARKTKKFIDFEGKKTAVSVDFNLDEYIKQKAEYINRMRDKVIGFVNHKSLNITYEFLLNNELKFSAICRFLGLKNSEFKPSTKQQETRSLSEIFTNYKDFELQLKDYE